MRRLSFPWVLSLLLVFAQNGAVLHELSHLSHGQQSGATLRAEPLNAGAACPTCESFEQVATPASGAAPSVAPCPTGILPTPEPCTAFLGAHALTPRSRGPPQA
jgi:hypothetical protein